MNSMSAYRAPKLFLVVITTAVLSVASQLSGAAGPETNFTDVFSASLHASACEATTDTRQATNGSVAAQSAHCAR